MNDTTAEELKNTARRLQNEGEEGIVQQLAPHIIPAMVKVPDPRLTRNADQQWFNHVPVPLDLDVLTNPLPLPQPKPDLAFGYSEAAFNRKQLMTIDLLVDDQFGRSHAVPDKKLRFPFLTSISNPSEERDTLRCNKSSCRCWRPCFEWTSRVDATWLWGEDARLQRTTILFCHHGSSISVCECSLA